MSGAAERFTVVFDRHHAQVLAYARRRADEAWAQDVTAETFLAAWRHLDRLPADPLPWLYRTAGNCLANQARSRRRQARLIDRIAGSAPASDRDHAEAVVESDRLRVALAELSDRDREALLLVAWEGLDHRAAAYAMGCTTATFRVRLHRARRRLSQSLSDPPGAAIRPPLALTQIEEI